MELARVFGKAREHNREVAEKSTYGVMREYAHELSKAVELISQIEAMLDKPMPPHIKDVTSTVTLQPLTNYHPDMCIRIRFSNKNKLPIGAELIAPSEDTPDGT